MPDTGPTKNLSEWLADEEAGVSVNKEKFRAYFGSRADQEMDKATLTARIAEMEEAATAPEGEAAPPTEPPAEPTA